MEALYLVSLGSICILKDGTEVSLDPLMESFTRKIPKFVNLLQVYRELRQEGWIVRSGLNYGTDFVLYRSNLDAEHAQYI